MALVIISGFAVFSITALYIQGFSTSSIVLGLMALCGYLGIFIYALNKTGLPSYVFPHLVSNKWYKDLELTLERKLDKKEIKKEKEDNLDFLTDSLSKNS